MRDITSNYNYTASNRILSLRQPLLRPYSWSAYRQGQAKARQGLVLFTQAQQDIVVRLTTAYFDILLAEETLRLAGAQKAAIQEQLTQAQRLFEGGEGTITDVNESQARLDLAAAQELEAQNQLEVSRKALERIVGRSPGGLFQMNPQTLVLRSPEPNDIHQWVEWAQQSNPEVQARRENVEIAATEVGKARADHLPTIDLVLSRSYSESDTENTIDTKYDTNSIGVQFSIPIFSGGYVNANVRQAEANRSRALQELESAMRKVGQDTSQAFLNVNSNLAKVKAYEQAVHSNEVALYSTRKGFEVGLRTNVDILNAQQQLYGSRRDLASARHDYIVNWIKLKSLVGSLSEDDIVHLNSWLSRPGSN
jgi:outer membrane protein